MTKSGASGPKSRARARARKERTGTKYTQARRGTPAVTAAGAAVPTEVTVMTFRRGEPLPRTAPDINWLCHRCGVATNICALTADAGEGHLRPYCPSCLPPPDLYPARRALADHLRGLQALADWPSAEDLARQVEAATGHPAAPTVRTVLSGAVLTRWDTVQALVRALGGDGGDVEDVLHLWQAADQEQSQGQVVDRLARRSRVGLTVEEQVDLDWTRVLDKVARREGRTGFTPHLLSDFD
ncbi:hypothetical protein ABR737_00225 [Streptomyces sp. Edi2]|uniref:hypothetical protein n=1 Tax=Streptomyces sp. Edi2 TaxID=3162528 RepID=UPI00330680C1